jgi:serine phosphatase RsbU (regulator of sigma subunit)
MSLSRSICTIFLFLGLLFPCFNFSQTGKFYINNFAPTDYSGGNQNWGCLQDKLGRLYVANLDGVLAFDGKVWKKTYISDSALVTSIGKGNDDVIYVGGEDQFGFLKRSPNGKILYESLSDRLPEKDQGYGKIWAVKNIGNKVYFCSNAKIFQVENKAIKVFDADSEAGFHTFFQVGDYLFVRERGKGFKVIIDDQCKIIPASADFQDPNNRVDFIFPLGVNRYLLGSRTLGTYILNYNPTAPENSTFEKRPSKLDEWMREKEVYCGVKVTENLFAIGTLSGGIMLADSFLNPIKKIDNNSGLLDDGVKSIYVDYNGNLWLSLNLGLSFIEINTPVTSWGKTSGIRGSVESAIKLNGKIYISNDKGVQVLDTTTNNFIATSISVDAWDMYEHEGALLVASSKGLLKLNADGSHENLYDYPGLYLIFTAPGDPKTFYIGTEYGIVIGHFQNGKFIEEKIIEDWGTVKLAAAVKGEEIYFATQSNGLFVFDPNSRQMLKNITTAEGLPTLIENSVFTYNNKIFIGTDKGIFKVKSKDNWKCVRANEFLSKEDMKAPVGRARQINNEIWMQISRDDHSRWSTNFLRQTEISVFVPGQSAFREDHKLLKRIKGADTKDFFFDNGKVYISTNNGLFCYDVSTRPNKKEFYTFISWFSTIHDSLPMFENFSIEDSAHHFELPFSKNEISIVPSASDFFAMDELEFSWYLEGKEKEYNTWQKVPRITYNNLREGSYVLHLKALNILGQEGRPVHFSFTITPPWYRSILAYVLYVIGIILMVWLIVALNLKRLKAANVRLERIITERTQIITDQKYEIELKNHEITDSINYAKRIQLSILPDIEEIKSNWKETFIFYQPKDIVSGDFFWWRKLNEDEFVIGVADCTGHGVPGGFMCMICSDKLHEGAKISSAPDKILYHANNAIKETLKQGTAEGGNKDGMEIAVLKVNKKTKEIQFSGANRFLWIIKKDTSEIIEIKPTKAGIASTTEYNFNYVLHTLQLTEGDRLYMSSDGFPDQFGGADGKKFMTKNFKSFILSIHNEPMEKQGELVKEKINNWMSGHEQVDDLLVVGIRL